MSKPLTQLGVEKALKDFGLDADSASHQSLASLSHGQRVKVVICACQQKNGESQDYGNDDPEVEQE